MTSTIVTPSDRISRTAERGTPPRATVPALARERLVALDVFRGMTIAGMLLVNNPGSWAAIYPPLEHAAWHGWTPTDLIFPFFLFIAGITTNLSLSARRERGDDDRALVRQVLRRGGLIFLFGLLLSAFPLYQWGPPSSWPFPTSLTDPSFLDRVIYRFAHLRIMGVLQRIALAYTLAGLLTLRTSLKTQVVIVTSLLYGYWFAMTLLPVPGHGFLGANVLDHPELVLSAWLDRTLLGTNHLWIGSLTWDPEGLLSTVPAIGTAMLGNFAGRWIGTARRSLPERLNGLFAAGAIAMMVGLMWNWSFPINKSLWTSSYVLFSAGMASVALASCMWLIDVQRVSAWTRPFIVYGVNPIVAFVGSGIMARLIYSMLKVTYGGRETSLENGIFQLLFASWLPPRVASLLFAMSFVLLWLGVLWILWRKRIILKV